MGLMLLGVLVLIVLLAAVPIMIGARIVGAERTEFGRALLVAFVLAILGMGVKAVVDNGLLQFLLGTAVGGFLISTFMGTTFWRGIAIGIIANGLQLLVVAVFAGALVVAS